MVSFGDGNSSPTPNAFSSRFLHRFNQRDEPLTAAEADAAGPWFIEEIPAVGYGLFRAGESLSRGFRPAAIFPDRWLALVAAAVLPGSGRDPLCRLATEPDAAGGYGVVLDDGAVVGRLHLFDEPLVDAVNVAVNLVRSPRSLAYLLEAAGPLCLERCGAILDQWVTEGAAE